MSPAYRPLWDRFWEKVDVSGDCWVWTAAHRRDGYGQVRVTEGVTRGAHQVSYQLLVGEVPAGLELDHLCRNRSCVNPDHLQPVTRIVNMLRGSLLATIKVRAAQATHCRNGHEWTPENTGVSPMQRWCRTCNRKSVRQRRARLQSERVA